MPQIDHNSQPADLPLSSDLGLTEEQAYARVVRNLMAEAFTVFERHGIEVAWNRNLDVPIL